MKLNLKKHRRLLIAGSLVLLTATPSFGLLGLPTLVFDPTSYAELITQATTVYNQLKTMESNVTHFTVKELWQTTLFQVEHANVRNLFGETSGFSTALNTNAPQTSSSAWNMANVALNSNTRSYLSSQSVGNSTQISQLAMIEASDSISPNCMTAVGQYQAARQANASANSNLSQQELDTSDATNSEVEQLNLLNAAEAQKMTEMQSQGALQNCVASQMLVANMQQRNAAAQDLNTWAFVEQQQAANPTYAGNGSSTWTSYLP